MPLPPAGPSVSLVVVALIGVIWTALAFAYPPADVLPGEYLALLLLILLARAFPIAASRERRITFVAPVVFTVMLVVGPWAAGMLAVAACALHAFLLRRPHFWRTLRGDLIYAVATAPAAALFPLLGAGLPVRLGESSPSGAEAARLLISLLAAAGVYFAGIASPLMLRLRFRLRPSDVQTTMAEKAMVFVAGLPSATVLVVLRRDPLLSGTLALFLGVAAVLTLRAWIEQRALRKQVRAMEALGRLAIDAQNEESLLGHLFASVHDLIPFDRAFVWAADAEGESLHLRASRPTDGLRAAARPMDEVTPSPPPIAVGEGLVGRVAERRRGLIIASGDDPRWNHSAAPSGQNTLSAACGGMASVMIVPLITARRTIGVALFAHRDPGVYAPRDLHQVQGVANLVASAIENVRLHQSIRALAVTDGLTGLTNHRRLQEVLTEEIWRSGRYGRPVSVILCDVDSFKNYNDTYGHPQGDELLKSMARVLQGSVRSVDTVARYGGEEFCIVLPETGRVQAWKMAERLRSAVETSPFPGKPDGGLVRKTMSFGVASYPEDTPDAEQLVPLADAALYVAKRSGKNQVQGVVRKGATGKVASAVPQKPRPSRRSRR